MTVLVQSQCDTVLWKIPFVKIISVPQLLLSFIIFNYMGAYYKPKSQEILMLSGDCLSAEEQSS